jgi:hypothetical protein
MPQEDALQGALVVRSPWLICCHHTRPHSSKFLAPVSLLVFFSLGLSFSPTRIFPPISISVELRVEYNSDDLGRERICNLVELEPWRHIRLKPGGAEIL